MTERKIDITTIDDETMARIKEIMGVPPDAIISEIIINPDVIKNTPDTPATQSELYDSYDKCAIDVAIRTIARNP